MFLGKKKKFGNILKTLLKLKKNTLNVFFEKHL